MIGGIIIQTIKLNTDLNLPLHRATLNYIGGLSPKLEWEARGISAHDKNKKAEQKLENERKKVEQFLNTTKGQDKLNNFLQECSKVFLNLFYKDESWLKEYFKNKKFVFIIGAMRTAGTYLYTELSKILEIDWRNLNLKMSHDNIPTYSFLQNWNQQQSWLPLIFEIAQFLVWAHRECLNQEAIIQKRIAYGHALPVLNNIFGDRAEYIITVRHPGGIAASFKQLEDIDMKNIMEPPGWKRLAKNRKGISYRKWNKLSYSERALIYWQIYYEDLVRYGLPEGDIIPLGYGQNSYESFLKKFAKKHGKKYQPDKFKVTNRNYSDFWKSEKVNNVIKQVNMLWEVYGLEFPELKLQ